MIREALIDGSYRYHLTRRWGPSINTVLWVMLNPSTADADVDDPTIRRCIGFSAGFGADSARIINLYAYRATDPASMLAAADPVGPRNDEVTEIALADARILRSSVIVAWGANARADRVTRFVEIARNWGVQLHCLGITKGGMPRHPLYLPKTARLTPWVWSG